MMNDLDAGVLLIVESARERIAEHQDIDAGSLKILQVVQEQFFRVEVPRGRLNLPLTLPLAVLTLTALLPVLPLTGLLLRLILPGLLGLGVGEDGWQRKEHGRDEGGTGAEVHADDPYSAVGIAVVWGLWKTDESIG